MRRLFICRKGTKNTITNTYMLSLLHKIAKRIVVEAH